MNRFFNRNTVFYIAISSLFYLGAGAAPAQAAPGPRFQQLKHALATDPARQAALLREALAAPQALALDERLWVLTQLSKAARKADRPEEALRYLRQAQREAGTQPIAQVYASRHLVKLLMDLDRRQEAMTEYTKVAPLLPALRGAQGVLDGQLEAAEGWLAGGTVMSSLGQLPEATDLLVRALAVFDARDGQGREHVRGQVDCLDQIANLYYKSGNLDAALRELQRAIDLAEQAGESGSLSRLYMRKGVIMSSKGDPEGSYQALIRARKEAQAAGEAFNLAMIATNLSDIALQRKDYRAALRFVEEAIPLVATSGDREALLICRVNKGLALNRLGKVEGLELVRQAIDEFTLTPGKQHIAADLQGALAEELAFDGKFEQAYAAAVDFKRRTDEVRKASDQKRIADSTARYQADKRQRQIELLEQEQRGQRRMQWLWGLAGVLAVVTVASLIVSRIYLQRAYRKVKDMSLSDPLTGLRNRRYLASRIDSDLAQSVRQRAARERAPRQAGRDDLVFVMLDMDHFKSVNDVHGHGAGDAVLKQLAAILKEEVRDADIIVRWGGEEFLVVARQTSCAEAHLLAERLRARVAAHAFDIGGGTVLRKTCSIGFASYPFARPGQIQPRWEDVVELADQCLYAAKSSGRDMWVGILSATPAAFMSSERDVQRGLREGAMRLEASAGREVVWPEVETGVAASASAGSSG
jgi:diguanylate cyclase (GGDEF)-like protein